MTHYSPENVQASFKCSRCGNMFEITAGDSEKCPVCGNICTSEKCNKLESSDEGF